MTPLTGEKFKLKTANTDDHARLDESARGVWVKRSKAYFDIRDRPKFMGNPGRVYRQGGYDFF